MVEKAVFFFELVSLSQARVMREEHVVEITIIEFALEEGIVARLIV